MSNDAEIWFKDENNVPYGVKHLRNMPMVVAKDFNIAVAAGEVSGHMGVNKYGRNIQIQNGITADIWDGGHHLASGGDSLIWLAPTAARIHQLASSDANDTILGDGARTVRISGLPDWDTAEISETIEMNGTTDVPTTNAYVIIHRMEVTTWGDTPPNVGTIKATADTDGTVTARIRAGQGQTQMAIYGIPSIQTAYLGRLYGNYNKGGGSTGVADCDLCVNTRPDEEITGFVTKHTFGFVGAGTSARSIQFWIPKIFVGPTIMKVQIRSGTNSTDMTAGFDLMVVDN